MDPPPDASLPRLPGGRASDPPVAPARLATRTRERHAAVHQLRERGATIAAISRELGLDRRTVRRFVRTGNAEELLGQPGPRTSLLDAYKPYQHERFTAGHTNAGTLSKEVAAMGYAGASRPCGSTCIPSGLTGPGRHPHPLRPASGGSPAGSPAASTMNSDEGVVVAQIGPAVATGGAGPSAKFGWPVTRSPTENPVTPCPSRLT